MLRWQDGEHDLELAQSFAASASSSLPEGLPPRPVEVEAGAVEEFEELSIGPPDRVEVP